MKRTFIFIPLLILTAAALAEPPPPTTLDLWPEGKMPGKGTAQPESEKPPRGDNVRRVADVSRPTITVFPAPAGKDAASPAIVVCPGGGYAYLAYDQEGTDVAAWLNSQGVAAIVLKYRVPNNRAGALQDVQRALSLTRSRAADWRIDPKRLGVMGFSAGGHLAAKAATAFDRRAYEPIDAADKESCRPDFAILVYPAYLEKDGKVAADLDLKANVPPTLIVHTEDDKTFIAGSRLYHAALDEAKIPNDLIVYPTGGHGFALRSTKDAKAWPDAAIAWMTKVKMR
jgi:acetyl esterase/lipase